MLCSAVCCGRPVWGSVLAGQGLGVGGREGEIGEAGSGVLGRRLAEARGGE